MLKTVLVMKEFTVGFRTKSCFIEEVKIVCMFCQIVGASVAVFPAVQEHSHLTTERQEERRPVWGHTRAADTHQQTQVIGLIMVSNSFIKIFVPTLHMQTYRPKKAGV